MMRRFSPESAQRSRFLEKEEREKKEVDRIIDAELQLLLVRYARRKNEGNNGIIFRLDRDDVPEEKRQLFADAGMSFENDQAVKVLKVYAPGAGRQEFEHQQFAADLIPETDDRRFARIPKPLFYRDINLSPESAEILFDDSFSRTREERAEIVGMEFIPGEDLATILYKEALHRKFPELYPSAEDVDTRNIDELQREVATALDFRLPGGKARDEAARLFEEEKVYAENAEKLFIFLKRHNFVLDPVIAEQIRNTLDLLHRNGLVHRDAHERNFMVTGSYTRSSAEGAVPAQAYVIDFGTATRFAGSYGPHLYQDVSRRYMNDDAIVGRLLALTESKEEMISRYKREDIDKLRARLNELRKGATWKGERTLVLRSVREGVAKNPADAILNCFLRRAISDDGLFQAIDITHQLVQQGNVNKDVVLGVLRARGTEERLRLSAFGKNTFRIYLQYLQGFEVPAAG